MRKNKESDGIEMNKKCQVFTPENYVRELLDSVGYIKNLYGKKILENSCGDGNILVAVVQRYIDDCRLNGLSRTKIRNGLSKDIYGVEIDEEQYEKCIENLNILLKRNGIGYVEWNIINTDYLKWKTQIQFQYIVGNPPYITYRELGEDERLFVKNNFSTCSKGKFDYCYAFIEKSIKYLSDDGKMAYLIPSSIFKTVFGQKLREYMSPYIFRIKDYTQTQIFDKALVKSAIMMLDKQRKKKVLFYSDMNNKRENIIYIDELDKKWFFVEKSQNGKRRFGDYYNVSHVVATLFNKAYVLQDGEYIETINGYVCNKCVIEKDVVRNTETPRTLRYNKNEKIIFPYSYDINGIHRFDDGEFERLYPGAAAYLNGFRNDLDNRKSDTGARWYEYGRSQALGKLNREKLLISTVVTNTVEVYELNKECIPYSGMYIVESENNTEYTLQDAVRILKSDEFKQYVYKVGSPMSGKSVRITSKDIENYMF